VALVAVIGIAIAVFVARDKYGPDWYLRAAEMARTWLSSRLRSLRGDALLAYEGRYPRELLATELQVAAQIDQVLGRDAERVHRDMGVQGPVRVVGDWLVLNGCRPHFCGDHRAVVAIELGQAGPSATRNIFAAWSSRGLPGGLKLYPVGTDLPEEVASLVEQETLGR